MNKVLKLRITARKVTYTNAKGKQNTFKSFKCLINGIVKGQESQGKQKVWVDLKLRKDADTNADAKIDDLRSGWLIIPTSDDIQLPMGKIVLWDKELTPQENQERISVVWVKAYSQFEPFKIPDVVVEDMLAVDDETGEIVQKDEDPDSLDDIIYK